MQISQSRGILDAGKRVHLLGIGGAGMSGLALLLNKLGLRVSGCDMAHTCYVEKVKSEGIPVAIGHDPLHVANPQDLVIYSSAVDPENPEILAAKKAGIPIFRRAEILSVLFNERLGIGVAGTHGKTTTSSMISLILERAALRPTVAIGGELSDMGCNAKLGIGNHMVAELDESDGSFELFHPNISVVTNVDWDHVDHYPDLDSVIAGFTRFLSQRKEEGLTVVCGEDPGVRKILERGVIPPVETYGWGASWTWGAHNYVPIPGGGASYSLLQQGEKVMDVKLSVSGKHNVMNSLAGFAVASYLGIDIKTVQEALSSFQGAKRRMQLVGRINGINIYDDYAHHPREVQVTLDAMRNIFPDKKLIVLFQPHRYTRTAVMYKDFANALKLADEVLVAPIYCADEHPIDGISSNLIVSTLKNSGFTKVNLIDDMEDAPVILEDLAEKNNVILTVGAGDVYEAGLRLYEKLSYHRNDALAYRV